MTGADFRDLIYKVFKWAVLRKYRKLKVYGEELKSLNGSAAKKYRKEHSAELFEYEQIRKQVLEFYPSGHIPTVENLEKKNKRSYWGAFIERSTVS